MNLTILKKIAQSVIGFQLKTQFEQSDKLEAEIKKNLAGLGYDV